MRIFILLLSMTLLFTPLVSAKENVDKVVLATPPLVNYNPKDNIPVDIKPVLLYQPEFKVPENYIPSTESANIWMSVLVNSEGKVLKANIEYPCRDSILNDIALNSAFEYSFKPAIKDGQPVFYWVWWKMKFTTKSINKILTFKVTLDFDDYYPTLDEFTPLDFPPEMIHNMLPKYPRVAKVAGIQGTVWIKALVNIKGDVVKAEVAKTSGTVALDDAALIVAKENKFKPAKQNGKTVAAWAFYKEEFKLDN